MHSFLSTETRGGLVHGFVRGLSPQQALITLISLTWDLHTRTIHPLALELHLNPGLGFAGAAVSQPCVLCLGVRCSWCGLALGPALFLQIWLLVMVTLALLAQILRDCTPVWGGGCLALLWHSLLLFSGRGYESHIKIDLGCCYESEIISFVSIWVFNRLLKKGPGLC